MRHSTRRVTATFLYNYKANLNEYQLVKNFDERQHRRLVTPRSGSEFVRP